MKPRIMLPRLLLDAGLADLKTLGTATAIATEADVPVVHALLRWHLVDAAGLAEALAAALDQPIHPLPVGAAGAGPGTSGLGAGVADVGLDAVTCRRLRILSLGRRDGAIHLAMSDPTDDAIARAIGDRCHAPIVRVLVNDDDLEEAIGRAYGRPGAAAPPSPRRTADGGADDDDANARRRRPRTNSQHREAATDISQAPVDVVVGEHSMFEPLVDLVDDAGSDMFVDARPPQRALDNTGEFRREAAFSEVFGNDTVDIPMPHQARPLPVGFGVPLAPSIDKNNPLDEATRELTRGDLSEIDVTLRRPLLAPTPPNDTGASTRSPVLQSDDRTVPNDTLLFLMRVLVVADDLRLSAVRGPLATRIKNIAFTTMDGAVVELEKRRVDAVVVIDPPNTIPGSQLVATLAARAKRGVWVLSATSGFETLPSVRGRRPVGTDDADTVDTILSLLGAQAHDET